eukprot:2276502-Prymnesium_polylepis.1
MVHTWAQVAHSQVESKPTGYICKAHTPNYAETWIGSLPLNIDELIVTLAEAFGIHPHSLKLLSRHQASGLYAHVGSQLDLDV